MGKHSRHRTDSVYRMWSNIKARCGNEYGCDPTYGTVSLCDEWQDFDTFADWAKPRMGDGLHLDKDLLGDGSLYSPATCCFISRQTNNSLKLGKGYKAQHSNGRLQVSMKIFGKDRAFGTYDTEAEARSVYMKVKASILRYLAPQEGNLLVMAALLTQADEWETMYV